MLYEPMPLHVLIVDDEKPFAEVISELLTDEGYSVQRVFDADAAMDVLADPSAGAVDVLLCDVMLPGLRGDKLALEIRRRFPLRRLPIILLSAGGDPQVELPDAWFMSKPLDITELLALVHNLVSPTPRTGRAAL